GSPQRNTRSEYEPNPERIPFDRADNSTDDLYIVTDGAPHYRIPCDAGLHGNKDTGDQQNDRRACSLGLLRKRDDSELNCNGVRFTEIRNRALLRFEPAARRISVDGLPQMVFDLLPHALRQRPIETEGGRERFEIVGNHAGLLRGRVPARRLPMASENCCQTARRSVRARSPCRVNA